MDKQETVMKVLTDMGYLPRIDNDGDVAFRCQMKELYVMDTQDEGNYLCVMIPGLISVEEDEIAEVLAVCNKMTREMKFIKLYINPEFTYVYASCEFYYSDEESMKVSMDKAIDAMKIVRTLFRTYKSEMEAEE